MTKAQVAIRKAFDALCEHQSPSSSGERKRRALVRCWEILSDAIQNEAPTDPLNNWSYGKEKELSNESR
jgi:hypothetical protein